MKNLKRILVLLIAVIALTGSAAAFAFWDTLTINRSESNLITIGEGLDLVVENVVIDPTTDGYLIPASAQATTGSTYEVVLTYDVNLDIDVDAPLNLNVAVSNITVGGVSNPYDLINVEITNNGSIQNETVEVSLSVTIDDSELAPEDYEAAKLALENQTISFDIMFQAS